MGAHGSERIAGAEAAPSLVLVPAGKDERQELCVGHEVLAGLERRYVHLHSAKPVIVQCRREAETVNKMRRASRLTSATPLMLATIASGRTRAVAVGSSRTSFRPYSLSQPNDGKSTGFPSTACAGATATSVFRGAAAGCAARVGAYVQPAGRHTASMGSCNVDVSMLRPKQY